MKILGIACSPRPGGNTDLLVKAALAGGKEKGAEVTFLSLFGQEIHACDHCGTCYERGECRIQDDMAAIYPQLLEADAIILGSPVYFWSVSAQAKLFMDRTYALRYPTKQLKNKVGGAIAVAGRRGQLAALTLINTFFLGQEMIPASLGVDGRATKRGEIQNDDQALEAAKQLGARIVALVTNLKTAPTLNEG